MVPEAIQGWCGTRVRPSFTPGARLFAPVRPLPDRDAVKSALMPDPPFRPEYTCCATFVAEKNGLPYIDRGPRDRNRPQALVMEATVTPSAW